MEVNPINQVRIKNYILIQIVSPPALDRTITFSGRGTLAAYEMALSSVIYFNTAVEPTLTNRTVSFQVFDGNSFSNIANGVISIALVDDNPLMLMCGTGVANFEEESASPIPLAELLILRDADVDHMITGAEVSVQNPQLGDVLALGSDSGLSITRESDTMIVVTGVAEDSVYQVSSFIVS